MEKEDAKTFFSDCPDIYRKLSILDEPTTELHFKDIENLLIIFRKLVNEQHPTITYCFSESGYCLLFFNEKHI